MALSNGCPRSTATIKMFVCVTLFYYLTEIEKVVVRQPLIEGKDDYDSENSWISDRLPSSSRRRTRGDVRWEGGEWRE